ncbi:MAG TPA: hypothetical protein VN715_18050 [Roseiarcus sp.]|nr:hypothetical protein [Roseiarcus sp.]
MQKTFKHPLARRATSVKARLRDGGEQTLLVVLTTLELDEKAKGFNAKNIGRLRQAAEAFLTEDAEFAGYAILNRPKDW